MEDKQQYFVVKAPRENLDISLQTGLWATQRNNESKLVAAFREGPVVLLFSAIKSSRFTGYALMASLPDPSLRAQWKCPVHIELSACFRVEWKAVASLNFGAKPYFDCQRLPPDLGQRLCQQMEALAASGVEGAAPGVLGAEGGAPPADPIARLPRMQPTRFFVAKGCTEVLEQSIVHGVWATVHPATTDILVEAFYQGRVILLLAGLHDSRLYGFCRMQGLPDARWTFDWGHTPPPGGAPFEVKWYCSCDLMPKETNPWDKQRPVTRGADCTEVPPELGNDLCQCMWEQGVPISGHDTPSHSQHGAPSDPYEQGFGPPPLSGEYDSGYDAPFEAEEDWAGFEEDTLDFLEGPDPFGGGLYETDVDLGALGIRAMVNGEFSEPAFEPEPTDHWALDDPAARYFIIRAPRQSFETSLDSGLWATQRANEARLAAAFEHGPVVLLFCPVNTSKLHGFGVMRSLPSPRNRVDWQVPSHVALGESFQVQWQCVATVGVGRIYFDGEELAPPIGYRYCQRLLAAEQKEWEALDPSPPVRSERRRAGKRRGRKGETPLDLSVGGPPGLALPGPTPPLSQATRFFIIRSPVSNLQESLKKWVWAVGRKKQTLLAAAFQAARVMLLFAPTGRDRFLGFMKMVGLPGSGTTVPWTCAPHEERGDFFPVSWYCLCDVPPTPGGAPGPDLLELGETRGNELCQLMWENGHTAPKPEPGAGKAPGDPKAAGPADPEAKKGRAVPPDSARYFVVKAPRANVTISQKRGVWATHHRRQPGLLSAAQAGPVVLLFSALSTTRLQGYATIKGPPTHPAITPPWECSKRVQASLGEPFPVEWGAMCDEPTTETNPWAGDKPLWDCRDCQEVPPEIGQRVCAALPAVRPL